jgi:uncharacterized protein
MEAIPVRKEERTWAMFAHLSSLLGWIGIPLANLIAPLVIWQLRKDDMPFVGDQAKECLNFQISMTIYAIISIVLAILLIGIFFLIAVVIVDIIFTIIAAIKANEGVAYRYPLTIRFIK